MISCRPCRIARTICRATPAALTGLCFGQFGSVVCSMARSKNSVSVVPGLTTSTSIPNWVNSARIDSLKPCTANLLALYSLMCGMPRWPRIELMLTTIGSPAQLQQGQRRAGHFHQREEVDFHQPPGPLRIGAVEQPQRAHPGVVDEDVEPAKPRLGDLDNLLPGRRIGNVADDHVHRPPDGGDFLSSIAAAGPRAAPSQSRLLRPGPIPPPRIARCRWTPPSQSPAAQSSRVSLCCFHDTEYVPPLGTNGEEFPERRGQSGAESPTWFPPSSITKIGLDRANRDTV